MKHVYNYQDGELAEEYVETYPITEDDYVVQIHPCGINLLFSGKEITWESIDEIKATIKMAEKLWRK